MVLDRTDEEEDLVLPDPKTQRAYRSFHPSSYDLTPNIFRVREVYGYEGIVLEVAGGSQVVSVMLF